jgi:FG-GAP-like repeat
MNLRSVHRRGIQAGLLLAAMLLIGASGSLPGQSVEAQAAGSPRPRNYTLEQHVAMVRAHQLAAHPFWKDLSWSARIAMATRFVAHRVHAALSTSTSASTQTPAAFQGNATIISGSGNSIALQRLADCSLTFYVGAVTYGVTPTLESQSATPNFQNTLHSAAALTSTGNVFSNGCAEATAGMGERRAVNLGMTAQKQQLLASTGYDTSTSNNGLFYGTADSATMTVFPFHTDSSFPGIAAVAAGDLNGDGLADVVGIATTASISVWLAQSDGTLGTPKVYTLPGNLAEAAVLADVNGDGKLDVIVATSTTSGTGLQEQLFVLTGNGDGTLNAPQSMSVPTPTANSTPFPLATLTAAKLRSAGYIDLVGSNGLVLLNDGTGKFTVGASAFTPSLATSSFGPNLAAADFNRDGKMDIALDDGVTVHTYLGNGDGTFALGKAYLSNAEVGYLTASDLDGDGNVDLYIGLANGGLYIGDQFDTTQSYALMGNGDGSFQGMPSLPFVYTGRNLVDLNGDKIPDGVGVNADGSFTSYLGDGKGGFAAKATLVTSPVSIGSTQYTLGNIDSFALADINGDGIPDLAYIGTNLAQSGTGIAGPPGIFIALGNGQGGFAAPTFYAVPSTLATGDNDIDWTISNLQLGDVNHDGKADLIYSYSDTSGQKNMVYFGTVVQLSSGNGAFQPPQVIPFRSVAYSNTYAPTYNANVVALADLNKDGNLDLIFLSPLSGTTDPTLSSYIESIQVALGKGDGTFGTPATVAGPDIMVTLSGYYGAITVADMNGDGNPDIVALGSSTTYTEQAAIALGNGDGTFKAPSLTTYSAQYLTNYQGIAVADFNGDGKPDVVITDPFDPSGGGISFGNGDGTLQTVTANSDTVPNLSIGLPLGGATVALDLNGDGKPDVLAGPAELLSVAATGAGSGTTASPSFTLAASSDSATVAPGASASTTLTVTPAGGFDQTVTLSCSGLPTGATCTFSPASVGATGSAATSTLTIATTAATAANTGSRFDPLLPGGVLLAGVFAPFWIRRRRLTAPCAGFRLCALAAMGLLVLQSCGGDSGSPSGAGGSTGSVSGGTPAGTTAIVVTATGGSISQTLKYQLTVS